MEWWELLLIVLIPTVFLILMVVLFIREFRPERNWGFEQMSFDEVRAIVEEEGASLDQRWAAYLWLYNKHRSRLEPLLIDLLDIKNPSLDPNQPNLRRFTIDLIGRFRRTEALDKLISLIPYLDAGEAYCAAVTLGELGEPRAEETLLKLLERDEVDVKKAAADALALVGTTDSVQHLVSSRKGFFTDPDLRSKAKVAVEMITSRIEGAGPGSLAVFDETAASGGLSVQDDQASGLSLANSDEDSEMNAADRG